jgi:transposase
MAGGRVKPFELSPELYQEVAELACSVKEEHRLVERAKMIMRACEGQSNAEIARSLGCTAQTVGKWCSRMREARKLTALDDRPRSGRPAEIPAAIRCEVIKLACDRPEGTTFRQIWTLESLRDCVAANTNCELSRSEVHRILQCGGIRPHHVRMWLHSPDPDFQEKVKKVCELYVNPPAGATVLCVDEKPGMLARERKHPTQYSNVEDAIHYEFEYIRHGTSTLIGAFNTQTGEVFGQCRPRTGDGIVDFMEAIAKRYPTGPIYIVWDNLNIHKGQRWEQFNARHGGRFHFVHTPLHASWVNQIEIWFSILQRRLLKYGSFRSTEELDNAVLGFIQHWNRIDGHAFNWKFRGIRKSRTRVQLAA